MSASNEAWRWSYNLTRLHIVRNYEIRAGVSRDIAKSIKTKQLKGSGILNRMSQIRWPQKRWKPATLTQRKWLDLNYYTARI